MLKHFHAKNFPATRPVSLTDVRQVIRMPHLARDVAEEEPGGFFDLEEEEKPSDFFNVKSRRAGASPIRKKRSGNFLFLPYYQLLSLRILRRPVMTTGIFLSIVSHKSS